jgi:ParB family chromosome partitioning protein
MADSLKDRLKVSKRDILFGYSRDLPRIIELRLEYLSANPDQPRQDFNSERLQELATSIERHGLLQPIVVKPNPALQGNFIVVAGERRLRAHQLLQRETIAAIMTDGNADELALIENLQREDLSPIEEAEALEKIMTRYGYTQEELAQVVGKSRTTINELLSLNSLPAPIREDARQAQVNKSLLVELNRLKPAAAQQAWQQIKTGQLTVRELRQRKGKPSSPLLPKLLKDSRKLVKSFEQAERKGLSLKANEQKELLELHQTLGKLIKTLSKD